MTEQWGRELWLCTLLTAMRGRDRRRLQARGRRPQRGRPSVTDHITSAQVVFIANAIADRRATLQSIRDAWHLHDKSYTTVTNALKRFGLWELWRLNARRVVTQGVMRDHVETLRQGFQLGKTLQEIGDELGITRERVRQLGERYGCNAPRKLQRRRLRNQRWIERAAQRIPDAERRLLAELSARTGKTVLVQAYPKQMQYWLSGVRVHLHFPNVASSTSIRSRVRYWRTSISVGDAINILVCPDGQRAVYLPPHRGGQIVYVRTLATPITPGYENVSKLRRYFPQLWWLQSEETADPALVPIVAGLAPEQPINSLRKHAKSSALFTTTTKETDNGERITL